MPWGVRPGVLCSTSSSGSEDVDDDPATPINVKMHALEMRWSAQKSIVCTDDGENPMQGRQPTAIESPKTRT